MDAAISSSAQPIQTGCPVHILQGMEDPDVPWSHALQLVEHLPGDSVSLTLIKDGDHRLSRPEDLERLIAAVGGNRLRGEVVSLMQAHRRQVMRPGIGDRGVAVVGQQDGLAAGGQRARKAACPAGASAPAGTAGRPRRTPSASHRPSGPRPDAASSATSTTGSAWFLISKFMDFSLSSGCRHTLSGALMSILRTIRSGSGRTRSIDKRPLDRSAPITSMPSTRRKVR